MIKSLLTDEQWKAVFEDLEEMDEDAIYELGEFPEVVWFESLSEEEPECYAIIHGSDVLGEGFESEYEAEQRLDDVINRLHPRYNISAAQSEAAKKVIEDIKKDAPWIL